MGVIYLLKTREFVNCNKNVFKIGKSNKPGCSRTSDYPKGSVLFFLITVINEDLIERKAIDLFSKEFIRKKEYGNEYFEGEYIKMVRLLFKIVEDEERFLDMKIDLLDDVNVLMCQFCLQVFKSKWYKNLHEKGCKQKNDPVRCIEIEKRITPTIPENHLQCRFCNYIFSRTVSLNKHTPICKSREKYLTYIREI